MFGFYVILTIAFLYIALIGGVIGYLIGKYWKKKQRMKNKILNLVKEAVWLVLCLVGGALAIEGICSLANRKEPAKEFSTTVFTKNGHDYLLVYTKHGVCVIHAESCPCRKKKQRIRVQTTFNDKLKKHSSHHASIPDWMHDCA